MFIINEGGGPSNILKTMNLLLGSQLKVTMRDGRIVTGNFVSLDRLGNIVLENVVENKKVAYNIPASNNGITSEKSKEEDKDKEDNQQIQQTSTDSSIIQWDTQRSLTQGVILGNKLLKVEIEKSEWKKCMNGE